MDSGSVRYIVDDHSSSCDIGVLVGGVLDPTMAPNSVIGAPVFGSGVLVGGGLGSTMAPNSMIEAPVIGSGTSPFIIVPFVGSSSGGVPFVGSSDGGVSLRLQGALPKPNHRNTTKICS